MVYKGDCHVLHVDGWYPGGHQMCPTPRNVRVLQALILGVVGFAQPLGTDELYVVPQRCNDPSAALGGLGFVHP